MGPIVGVSFSDPWNLFAEMWHEDWHTIALFLGIVVIAAGVLIYVVRGK